MSGALEESNSPPTTSNTTELSDEKEKEKDYILLREDFPNYDYSFKVIVIGNSGKYKIH